MVLASVQRGNRMKSALNSIGVQIIAAVVLLACAAALTNQCVEQGKRKERAPHLCGLDAGHDSLGEPSAASNLGNFRRQCTAGFLLSKISPAAVARFHCVRLTQAHHCRKVSSANQRPLPSVCLTDQRASPCGFAQGEEDLYRAKKQITNCGIYSIRKEERL